MRIDPGLNVPFQVNEDGAIVIGAGKYSGWRFEAPGWTGTHWTRGDDRLAPYIAEALLARGAESLREHLEGWTAEDVKEAALGVLVPASLLPSLLPNVDVSLPEFDLSLREIARDQRNGVIAIAAIGAGVIVAASYFGVPQALSGNVVKGFSTVSKDLAKTVTSLLPF